MSAMGQIEPTGNPWKDLNIPVSAMAISEASVERLADAGVERLVDMLRVEPGRNVPKDINVLRRMATEAYETFIGDFLEESLEPGDALTANIGLISEADPVAIRDLWDHGVTTMSMLAALDPEEYSVEIRRWIDAAGYIASASRVPPDVRAMFNREFDPNSMLDVIRASPRYLLGIGPKYSRKLRRWGIENVGTLSMQSPRDIRDALKIPPSLATGFVEKAGESIGATRPPESVEEALADLRTVTERFRVAMTENDIDRLGDDVAILSRDLDIMLGEYITFVETTERMRRGPD